MADGIKLEWGGFYDEPTTGKAYGGSLGSVGSGAGTGANDPLTGAKWTSYKDSGLFSSGASNGPTLFGHKPNTPMGMDVNTLPSFMLGGFNPNQDYDALQKDKYQKTAMNGGGFWDLEAMKAAGRSTPKESMFQLDGTVPAGTMREDLKPFWLSQQDYDTKKNVWKSQGADYFGKNFEVATLAGGDKAWGGAHAIRDKNTGKVYYVTDPTINGGGILRVGPDGMKTGYRNSFMQAAGDDYTMGTDWAKEFNQATGFDQNYVDQTFDGKALNKNYVGYQTPVWGSWGATQGYENIEAPDQSISGTAAHGGFRKTTEQAGNDFNEAPDYLISEFDPMRNGLEIGQQTYHGNGFMDVVDKIMPMVASIGLGSVFGPMIGNALSGAGVAGTATTGLSGILGKAGAGMMTGGFNAAGQGGDIGLGALTGGLSGGLGGAIKGLPIGSSAELPKYI